MTLEELKVILDQTGLKVGYRLWAVGQAPPLPYILYYVDEEIGFKDKGIAQSTWGGEEWHEMSVSI